MARISVDDKISRDPRITRLAQLLNISRYEAVGRLVCDLWQVCYDQQCAEVDARDLETVWPGIVKVLLEVGLGSSQDKGRTIRVAGASERIEYLIRQSISGRKGGIASGHARKTPIVSTKSNDRSSAVRSTDLLGAEALHERPLKPPIVPDTAPDVVNSKEITSCRGEKGSGEERGKTLVKTTISPNQTQNPSPIGSVGPLESEVQIELDPEPSDPNFRLANPDPKPKRELRALPKTWKPRPHELRLARDLGIPDDQIDNTVEEFRTYWLSRGKQQKDWDLTFANNLRRLKLTGVVSKMRAPPSRKETMDIVKERQARLEADEQQTTEEPEWFRNASKALEEYT